jgi:5-methylcytosine-specific restriction endonuclease McrA
MASNRNYTEDGKVWTEYRNKPSPDLGKFLRAAQTDKGGNKIYGLMRDARPGDLVVHFLREKGKTYIVGFSRVAKRWRTQVLSNRKYHRVELRNFVGFGEYRTLLTDFIKANFADIITEMRSFKNDKKPHYYPFALSQDEVRPYEKGYFSEASTILKKALLAELHRLGHPLGSSRPPVRQTDLGDEFSHEVEKARASSPDDRKRRLKEAPKKPMMELRQVWVFRRNPDVVAEVLNTATKCQDEACKRPIPFLKVEGHPYLEVHHRIPLSVGGDDTVDNAIALCPNCHRKLHYQLRQGASLLPPYLV